MNLKDRFKAYAKQFSFVGVAAATLFFAASVTPSLLPRHYVFQGLLSGLALCVGYGVGVGLVQLYHLLEFRDPPLQVQKIGIWITTLVVALAFVASLRQMTFWQNSIREQMEMPAVESAYPWRTLLIAITTGMVLIGATRFLISFGRMTAAYINRFVPRRISLMISSVLVVVLVLLVGKGIVARSLLEAADSFFLFADEMIDEGVVQPASRFACGSKESLVNWDTIGRRGKNFIVGGPTKAKIAEFLDSDALEPIRVYVGMRSRDTYDGRAELALEELKRVGGFERSTLIIATPTGTGWLDPGGVDTVEYLVGGDSAIVSMQYSYLPSWLTILVDPKRSIESAEALFDAVYNFWTTLPKDNRPKLYLYGLSLGSLGSEASADLITIFEDPIQGGLFSGPPFPSGQWSRISTDRNTDSPQWLPTYRDGRVVRFMNQYSSLDHDQPWGPMRYVYIQYASDPMVFFSPTLLYREPDWMQGERGQDVSPYLEWRPIVTFLQLGFDLPMATSVTVGYGHNYAPKDYIDGWIAVTEPPEWSEQETVRLKAHFEQ